ncbi:NYN domain-containing protein [Mesorhizobium australicum]
MPTEPRSPRLAVLIDADNASAKIADGLFEEIAKIGEASVRRIYGDFSSARSKGWADILSKHAIIPQQQFAYTVGKNASDITLVIDAMDLLHSSRFDGFCLVSSDSDFTRLAARIREQGVDVFGFGERKTPESFRQACRRFIYTENLLRGAISVQDAAPATKPLQSPNAATPILRKVIGQMDSEDGWVSLSNFGKQLLNLFSDFDPRTYGFGKLSDLVRETAAFEIDKASGGAMRIRINTAPTKKGKTNRGELDRNASARVDSQRRIVCNPARVGSLPCWKFRKIDASAIVCSRRSTMPSRLATSGPSAPP